jgi:hypothetical protein
LFREKLINIKARKIKKEAALTLGEGNGVGWKVGLWEGEGVGCSEGP